MCNDIDLHLFEYCFKYVKWIKLIVIEGVFIFLPYSLYSGNPVAQHMLIRTPGTWAYKLSIASEAYILRIALAELLPDAP